MNDAFYNTINLAARDLSIAEECALGQEQRILRFFIRQGNKCGFAPSAVRSRVFNSQALLTSVRRAMSSLTRRGDLVKSAAMIQGKYGKPEHLWTVAAKWNPAVPAQGELL